MHAARRDPDRERHGLPGSDTIALPAGAYDLTVSGPDGADPAATGDLDITQDLTIVGADQGTTTIDGNGIDRVFDVAGGTATISGVTVSGGQANDGAFTTAGGGIRVGRHPMVGTDVPGTLTLVDSTLSGNGAQDGAGIATDSVAAHLTLTRVLIMNNAAPPDSTEGGGVNERFGGSVVITDSLIRGNSAQAGGGIVDDGGGTVSVTGSAIDGNHAAQVGGVGGGVLETGGGTVTRHADDREREHRRGGRRRRRGRRRHRRDRRLGDPRTTSSTEPRDGGRRRPQGFLGARSPSPARRSPATPRAPARASRSPLPARSRSRTARSRGNHASTRGGGIQATGAGTLTLTNVTLHDDVADSGASEIDNCVTRRRAAAPRRTRSAAQHDRRERRDELRRAGHVRRDTTSTRAAPAASRPRATCPGRAPLLGPLATNGGPTPTQAELAGSPTIDAGRRRGVSGDRSARHGAAGRSRLRHRRVRAAGPAPPAAPPAAKPVPPKPTPVAKAVKASDIIVFPSAKACVSRRGFHIRLRRVKGCTVLSASVSVNGKRVQVVKGRRLTAGVDLRGLPRGRFTVKIALKRSAGKILTGSRRYRTCTAKRRGRTTPKR